MKRIQFFDQSTVKKERKRVAVDEKELTINGTTIFIWGAVDLGDEKVIAVWVSLGRSGLEAKSFLKKIKSVCKGRLPRISIDGASVFDFGIVTRLFIRCRNFIKPFYPFSFSYFLDRFSKHLCQFFILCFF